MHPSDVLSPRGDTIIRSPWLDTPSGNPLLEVDPISKAVYVLLAVGEDAAVVGTRLLPGPEETAAARAEAVAVMTAQRTNAELDQRHRAHLLRQVLPELLTRWLFLLHASGLFTDVTELSRIVGCHRASVYRNVDRAVRRLERHREDRGCAALVAAGR